MHLHLAVLCPPWGDRVPLSPLWHVDRAERRDRGHPLLPRLPAGVCDRLCAAPSAARSVCAGRGTADVSFWAGGRPRREAGGGGLSRSRAGGGSDLGRCAMARGLVAPASDRDEDVSGTD